MNIDGPLNERFKQWFCTLFWLDTFIIICIHLTCFDDYRKQIFWTRIVTSKWNEILCFRPCLYQLWLNQGQGTSWDNEWRNETLSQRSHPGLNSGPGGWRSSMLLLDQRSSWHPQKSEFLHIYISIKSKEICCVDRRTHNKQNQSGRPTIFDMTNRCRRLYCWPVENCAFASRTKYLVALHTLRECKDKHCQISHP